MARKPTPAKEAPKPAATAGGPEPFGSLKAANERYERVDYVDADGKKRKARVSGDSVSRAFVGATMDDLIKTVKVNKLGADVLSKVETATNIGLARMSLSNRLRAIVRKGEQTVTIRGVEITSLDQSVEPPAAKKPRAKKAA